MNRLSTRSITRNIALSVLCFMLAGCVGASKPLYHWGSYQESLYDQLVDQEGFEVDEAIVNLEEDVATALGDDLRPAPGSLMHLAYLYDLAGRSDESKQALLKEQEYYPESSAFIEQLNVTSGE
jgi:hypothetical protein